PEPEPEPEPEPVEPTASDEEGAAAPIWPDEFEEREQADESEAFDELVRPTPRARRRGKRRKGLWMTLFVLLIAAGGAGAYWWFQPELPIPAWSTITGKWSAITSTISAQVSALKARLRRAPSSPVQPQPRAQPPTRPATQPVTAAAPTRPSQRPPSQLVAQPAPLARLDVAGDSLTQVEARERRSEEHTSELQSRGHLVCRLLLEK